ncbi:hypothetical protein [Anaerofustis stercorihominis]|uniref:hypothetical protein n=1 Tax=Anaerofustis stercorihominis TaxID=214853 RepID=UPI003984588E
MTSGVKEYLSKIRNIDKTIENKKREIERLQEIATYPNAPVYGVERVQGSMNIHPMTDALDRCAELNEDIDRLNLEKKAIISIVEKMKKNGKEQEEVMSDIYDKSKAQIKAFRLPKPVRGVVSARIDGYSEYEEIANRGDDCSFASEFDIVCAIDARNIIKGIDAGLYWIDERFRDAIWERAMENTPWYELEEKYNWSESTLRKQYQKFMYGVASELGELYSKN